MACIMRCSYEVGHINYEIMTSDSRGKEIWNSKISDEKYCRCGLENGTCKNLFITSPHCSDKEHF